MSKSPSLRRIQADVRELAVDPSDRYHAAPLEDDMFEWHFTIRGADGTDFEGGVYHGRILLPTDYPFKPPNIVFLTPTGRFQTGVKVCLSFSAHHPELWQPAWGVRLILEALISFLPTPADGAIGALDWTPAERKRLARKSREYCCPHCGPALDLLPELGSVKKKSGDGVAKRLFQEEIAKLHMYQQMNEAGNDKKGDEDGDVAKSGDGGEKSDDRDEDVAAETPSEAAAAAPTMEDNAPETDGAERKVSFAERSSGKNAGAATAKQADAALREKAVKEEAPSTKSEAEGSAPDQDKATEAPTSVGSDEAVGRAEPVATVPSSISDPVVHAMFVTFLAIVVLLYRKVQTLLAELNELEG